MDKPVQNVIDLKKLELIRTKVQDRIRAIDEACKELEEIGIVIKTEVFVTDQWTELFKTAMYLCRQ